MTIQKNCFCCDTGVMADSGGSNCLHWFLSRPQNAAFPQREFPEGIQDETTESRNCEYAGRDRCAMIISNRGEHADHPNEEHQRHQTTVTCLGGREEIVNDHLIL